MRKNPRFPIPDPRPPTPDPRPPTPDPRGGYTLVELLVVFSIVLVIAGLAAFVWPGFDQRERSAQGASTLQNALLVARQRALLDDRETGLRLLADPNDPKKYNKAQFIAKLDDFTGGQLRTQPSPASGTPADTRKVELFGADLYGGFPNDSSLWQVQKDDYLQVHGMGLMHQIVSFSPLGQTPPGQIPQNFTLQLLSPLPEEITIPTPNYRIVRLPRVQGDDVVELPFKVAIDLQDAVNNHPRNPGPVRRPVTPRKSIDILFSPSGSVISHEGVGKLVFWIRDINFPDPLKGDPTMVVLYPQSGFIAGFPVDENRSIGGNLQTVK